MKSAVKEKWIAALRSGAYEQIEGDLWINEYDPNNAVTKPQACLLGVLTDLAVKEGIVDHYLPNWDDGEFGQVPDAVLEWAGLNEEIANTIVDLNDERKITFDDFAEFLARVDAETADAKIIAWYEALLEEDDNY